MSKLVQGERLGFCQSEDCIYGGHEDSVPLNYCHAEGKWLCDGCMEDFFDVEEFVRSNPELEANWLGIDF